jgi:glycosyltransferase involved in cell wall biosynthesis
MRVLVATDAWRPQVNGVVRTYEHIAHEAHSLGAELSFLTPLDFATVPCPAYPGIRLALPNFVRTSRLLAAAAADHVHIATEGPIGWMARRYCLTRGLPFTTCYHTKFPEFAAALLGIPASWCYAPLRRFHNAASGVMVATPSLESELRSQGFERLVAWPRGVDTDLFRPRDIRLFGKDEPVFLYVGRVSKEKNIEAFLDLKLPGKKVVVGPGPHLAALRRGYPGVIFAGPKSGVELALHYASADVFVFPSRSDTFGLVLLEAMASGLPVAAYPVTGPIDLVTPGVSGVLDEELGRAAVAALDLDGANARSTALHYSWANAARLFLEIIKAADMNSARPAFPLLPTA